MTNPIHLLPEHAPRVDARDHTCTVVPFPCDELIKQAAELSEQEYQFFIKEVGKRRHEKNNPEKSLNSLTANMNDGPLEPTHKGFGK